MAAVQITLLQILDQPLGLDSMGAAWTRDLVVRPYFPLEAYETITVDTVQRAIDLSVYLREDGTYCVMGGARPHYTDLRSPDSGHCDCSDYLWRDRLCKHIVAVLIANGDFRLWCRINELMDNYSAQL